MKHWSEVPIGAGSHRFQTTRWSMVVEATETTAAGRRALEELCRQYWPPIYAFARRRGYAASDALDLTQGFFVALLERESVARADADRGRFRTFLLTCFTHFLANEREKAGAQKRGGAATLIPIDAGAAEARFGLTLAEKTTPEDLFEKRWALSVIEVVLQRMREEFAARGRDAVFAELRCHLEAGTEPTPYAEHAARLGISAGAVKVTVHRMRQRFRELLLEEVGQTLQDGVDPRDEITALLAALGS